MKQTYLMKKKMMITEMKKESKTCQTTYNHLLNKKMSLNWNSKSNRLPTNNRYKQKIMMAICGSKMMIVKIKVRSNKVRKKLNKRRRKRRHRMMQKKRSLYLKTDTEWTLYSSDANQHSFYFV